MRSKFMKLIDSESFQSYSSFISSVINDIVKLIQLDTESYNESLRPKDVVYNTCIVKSKSFSNDRFKSEHYSNLYEFFHVVKFDSLLEIPL